MSKLRGWNKAYGGGMMPREGRHVQVVQHSFGTPVAMLMSRIGRLWYWEPSHKGSSTIPTHWRLPVDDDWPVADFAKPTPITEGEK